MNNQQVQEETKAWSQPAPYVPKDKSTVPCKSSCS